MFQTNVFTPALFAARLGAGGGPRKAVDPRQRSDDQRDRATRFGTALA